MKVFVIFLVLIGFVGFAHATEPEPVGVDMIEYGIFDPNDNNTHLLKVGTTYDIKAHFKSELDKQVSFKFLVQVQDKDKHWTEPVEEFVRTGTLYPNESKRFSFSWTPQYQGEFRTYVQISNPTTNTTMGGAPQFDFEVIQPNTDDPYHDYFPTYRIMNLKEQYSVNEPIRPYILKKDLDGCNAYRSEILKDDRRVWEHTFMSSCIMFESSERESEVQIPTTNESIKLSETGHYTLEIEIGSYELQESFSVEESEQTPKQFSDDTDWISIPVVGEYRNWELPKEPDVFNLQYRIINGTITDIESVPTLTVFDIASNNSGQIQLKLPKNYPFTNYPQDGRERDALYVNIDETRINTESVVIEYDDCFYNYSIPFKKDDSTIEFGFSKTLGFNPYVIEEVPNYCIDDVFAKPPFPRHIAIEFSPLTQTQLGTKSYEIQCKQNLVLIQKYDDSPACVTESTKLKLIERGWTGENSFEETFGEISTEGMEVKVISGVPPGQDFSDYAGDKVPEFVENEGQSKTSNTKYAKYNSLKSVIPQYDKMQVFTDEKKNEHDIVLGKKSVSADASTSDILNSQNYIWITKNAHREHVELDVYTTVKLNDGYRLVDINDEIKNAPLRDMMQLVDTDGEFIAIAPLDMWFVTSDYSYTIRGHLTEAQAIELANKILELEN